MCVELSKNVVLVIHNPIQYRFEKYCPLKRLLTYGKTDGRLKKSFATFWRGCVNCTFSRLSLERGFLVQLGTGHLQKHPFAVCCFRPPWVLKTRLHLALRQANLTWRPLLSNLNIKDVRVVLCERKVFSKCACTAQENVTESCV